MPNRNRGRNGNIDPADYGDYGTDDIRSMGGLPRAQPRARVWPQWPHPIDEREEVFPGPGPSHPNQRSVAEAFGYEVPRGYPYAGVASESRRGRFFGRGPKGYRRSDERIREEISDRLTTHPDIDASDIDIQVSRGIVTLNGTVEDRREKRLAEFIAEDALGVDDVQNRLKVRHGFWAALSGERATERELPKSAVRDTSMASREAGRASAARSAARRDAEAR